MSRIELTERLGWQLIAVLHDSKTTKRNKLKWKQPTIRVKLRLPICKIWCEIFQLFHSFVYFILLSVRKVLYIGER